MRMFYCCFCRAELQLLFGEVAIEFGYINDEVLKKYVEAKAVWEKEA